MPHSTPYRPTHDVSQPFNSGVATVYFVKDQARPGYQPVEKLQKKARVRFESQRLGISRYYSGRQNQIEIDRVIRIPAACAITNQDVVILHTGEAFRIDMVQEVMDARPKCCDLTLVRYTQKYEVIDECNGMNG